MMYNWFNSVASQYAVKPIVVAKNAPLSQVTGLYCVYNDYEVGDSFTVTVNPGNVDGFLSSEIVLTYNSDILRIKNLDTGFTVHTDDFKTPVLYRSSKNSVTASMVVLGNVSTGISVPGENLFEIEFEVIGEGAFSIDLVNIDMRDYQNNPIQAVIENRSIKGEIGSFNDHTPISFGLKQNYPNPFNMSTTIPYSVDSAGKITICIYNTLGQLVRTLMNDTRQSGQYAVVWNGTNDVGNDVTSGVYLVKLAQNNRWDTRSMLLIK
jgi:hypothetical protein